MDDPDDHATAAILRNDHIDFLDHEDIEVENEDVFRDDEDDNDDEEEHGFSHRGDGGEEGSYWPQ